MNSSTPLSHANQEPSKPEKKSVKGVKMGRIAMVVAIPVVLGVVYVAALAFGLDATVQHWFKPRLKPATGQIEFKGNPLTSGFVATKYLGGQWNGAVGPLDSEGKFTLETDGIKGAYVGRHKLMVLSMDNSFPPKSVVPGKFSQPDTTPLTIEVTASSETNHFIIKIDE